MTKPQLSDVMKKLVLFIIGIAILGTIIALGVYLGVELPSQQTLLHAPMNSGVIYPKGPI